MIEIREPDDSRLADYRHLKDVTLRRRIEPEGGLYIAESESVIAQAIEAGHRPRSFLIARDRVNTAAFLDSWRESGAPIYTADYPVLQEITGFHVHRGFLAAMHRPAPRSWESIVSSVNALVVVEDIVDHTNLGAVFRSVAGLGWGGVLLTPRCADPLYRRSVRVSMGAVFAVPWARVTNWPDDLAALADSDFTRVALTPDPDALELDHVGDHITGKVALLIGTEGPGLSRAALAGSDHRVRIRMAHGVDSLNVGAAAAIALWALRPA